MRWTVLLTMALYCLNVKGQTKKTIESRIEKVTVFLQGAQTERSSRFTVSPGKTELIFTNISPLIDKQSIQVKPDAGITVLSVIHQKNYIKEQQKQDEIREIELQKESQVEKIELQKNILNVFKQEENMIIANQQIGGANTGLKAADLKEAADFQRARLTEVYQKQLDAQRMLKKMETELAKLNKQLTELNQKSDISTSEIHVTILARETMNTNCTLTYLVQQAGWFPTYDVRVKDISSPINLQYKANLFQSSGEDWKDIKLFVSTGNPKEEGNKPVVNPWYLRYNYTYQTTPTGIRGYFNYATGMVGGVITDEKGDVLPGASVTIKGTRTGVSADNDGQFRIIAKPGDILVVSGAGLEPTEATVTTSYNPITVRRNVIAGTEVVVTALGQTRDGNEEYYSPGKVKAKDLKRVNDGLTTISYQPTTTVYEIKEPYTILNDGKTYMADIDGYEIKTLYEYYAAPKLEEAAFLTAKFIDWQELNLLPGEANLFFEGTFLGKSMLDVTHAGDTLNLSLGRDKSIVVKRTLLKDFSAKKFLGSNKTDTRQYEIVIRNNKQQPVSIIVEDQFPISTQKEIEVQDRKYDGAKLDDDSQKLTWQMMVDTKKENKLNFRYEVKYPKDKNLVLD